MSIEKLLRPKIIAVVGASEKAGFSGSVCNNLSKLKNAENVFFINPKRDSIFGKRCYKSLYDVPEKIDMTVICIPKSGIPDVLSQMTRLDCHAAVIFASGFSETGKTEDKLEEKNLIALAKELNISIMGPNCAGFINYIDGIGAFGLDIDKITSHGKVGVISQSGQVCLNILDMRRLDFSYVISAGNSSVVTMETYLDFLVNDEETKVIALYLEGITNPKAFIETLRLATKKKKPVIVLKTGSSKKGSQIASSHTGSLTGSDGAFDAIFNKYGVIRVADMEELISTALLFSTIKKLPENANFASMNLSGGETGICADLGEKCGINFPDFTETTYKKLKKLLPSYSTPNNPLDTTATLSYDPKGYAELVKTVLSDENIGMVLCGFTVLPAAEDPCIRCMTEGIELALKNGETKPLAMVSFAECSREEEIVQRLKAVNVPVLPSTLYSFRVLKYLADYIEYVNIEHTLEDAIPNIKATGRKKKALSEKAAAILLEKAGVPVSTSMIAKTKEDLSACIAFTGFPVVAKICSPDILHKSDIGGVKLNIKTMEELEIAFDVIMRNAYKTNPDADIEGVLVQKMVVPGTEMFIGVNVDSQFGPMVMCGLGGIFVEVFKDVALYPAPLNKDEARKMIEGLKSWKLLNGYRGLASRDIESLTETIVNVSKFAAENKNTLAELDINPVFVYDKGVCAADALIVNYED